MIEPVAINLQLHLLQPLHAIGTFKTIPVHCLLYGPIMRTLLSAAVQAAVPLILAADFK